MYIKRHIEATVQKAASQFSAVLLTGARQVGKTTLLRHVFPALPYITLDDPQVLQAAVEQSGTFFRINPPPVLVDEVQYAPNLFPYVKMQVDNTHDKGMFLMTGSQQFSLMRNVSESLAGRVSILSMLGLSTRELQGDETITPFVPTEDFLLARRTAVKPMAYAKVWETIWRGSMPEMNASAMDWQLFYASYTKTYLERDVRELAQVGDELKFLRFMTALAAQIGNLTNKAAIANDVGVSQPTIDRWLSILCASNIVYLLQPWHSNILKRAVKTPKVYFTDTGLAAYLTKWTSADVLESGAMAGAFFENYVVMEIIKSFLNAGQEAPVYFYRDKDQAEIDLIVRQGDKLYPIEIKKHADPSKRDIAAFSVLDRIPGMKRGAGGVVCMVDQLLPMSPMDFAVPVHYL